ncbi:MAG: GspH/FimT family pseudopilin [Acidobacteriota bacterium]
MRRTRGFSLVELLVVMAMIGIIAVISAPAFLNFSRASSMRASLLGFSSDFRDLRQVAITRSIRVKMSFAAGGPTNTRYVAFESTDGGTTWTNLLAPRKTFPRSLEKGVYFQSTTYTDIAGDSDSRPDIVFFPNGSVTSGTVVLRTDWDIAFNNYSIAVGPVGQMTTTKSHV